MAEIRYPLTIDLPDELMGDGIVLRPYRAGDGVKLWSLVDSERAELSHWLPWLPHIQTPVEAEVFARTKAGAWLSRESLTMGIFSADGRELHGAVGLSGFDWRAPSAEIGWFLREDARGNGYGTQAVRLTCKLAFEYLQLNRVWGSTNALNERSWKLFERVGFSREGHLRGERRDHHGDIRDTYVYGMLLREWAALAWAESTAK